MSPKKTEIQLKVIIIISKILWGEVMASRKTRKRASSQLKDYWKKGANVQQTNYRTLLHFREA